MVNKVFAYGVCLYKVEKNDIKILLCKSVSSLDKWGCLKGVKRKDEEPKECAKREFTEECSIPVHIKNFENYFEQCNLEKNIGIWLVNAKDIKHLKQYIVDDRLLGNFLSWENSKVKFFSIKDLPKIKQKQQYLIKDIKDFLQSKNQFH